MTTPPTPSSDRPVHTPTPSSDRTVHSRGTLASRITVLAVGVAVLTAVLAGLFTVGLTRASVERSARDTLARIADASADRADLGASANAAQQRMVRQLAAIGVESASVGRGGSVRGASPLARVALTPQRQQALLAGRTVSARVPIGGVLVLVEGRPTQAGGILLAQRLTDATADSDRVIRRMVLGLGIACAVAIIVSLALARRLARPLRRTAGAAHALAAGQRDVAVAVDGPAEVAEVAHALNTLSSSLTRSEARQRDFLLSVSHDLRTPLTGITGWAESLASGLVGPADAAKAGEVVLGEAKRLDRLVSDLLDLARLGADRQRFDPVPVDLVRLGHDLEAVWGRRCSEVGVVFGFETREAAARTTTDPARVRQLLDGLLENALRVTPAGRPIIVELRPADAGTSGSWVLEVRDGGPGLTDDDLAVAFEPSVLHDRYRGVRPVGTGLGLAIVDRLATLLGATVSAGHAAEGGARFTVRLP